MKKQNGYTLIELMLVSFIIGILAAVAMPAYIDYKLRAKFLDGLAASSMARSNIAEFYRYTGGFPVNNRAAGLALPYKISSSQVKSMAVEDGVIHVLFSGEKDPMLTDKYLTLRPVITVDEPTAPLYFACGYYELDNENQMVVGENKTNIDVKHLPSNCR